MRITPQNLEFTKVSDKDKQLILKVGQNLKALLLDIEGNNLATLKIGNKVLKGLISSDSSFLSEGSELKLQVLEEKNGLPVLKVIETNIDKNYANTLNSLGLDKNDLESIRLLVDKYGIRLNENEIKNILQEDKSLRFLLSEENIEKITRGYTSISDSDKNMNKTISQLVKSIIIEDTVKDTSQNLKKNESSQDVLKISDKIELNTDIKLTGALQVKNSTEIVNGALDKNGEYIKLSENDPKKEIEIIKNLMKTIEKPLELAAFGTKNLLNINLENIKGIETLFIKSGFFPDMINKIAEDVKDEGILKQLRGLNDFTELENFIKINNKRGFFKELGTKIEELFEELEKLDTKEMKEKNLIKEFKSTVEFIKNFNESKNDTYYFNIPFKNLENDYSADLFIKRNRYKNQDGKEKFSILVSLDTLNLGLVNSVITLDKDNISINFKVERESTKKLINDTLNLLKDRLEENVAISVVLNDKTSKFESIMEFASSEFDQKFDVKVWYYGK